MEKVATFLRWSSLHRLARASQATVFAGLTILFASCGGAIESTERSTDAGSATGKGEESPDAELLNDTSSDITMQESFDVQADLAQTDLYGRADELEARAGDGEHEDILVDFSSDASADLVLVDHFSDDDVQQDRSPDGGLQDASSDLSPDVSVAETDSDAADAATDSLADTACVPVDVKEYWAGVPPQNPLHCQDVTCPVGYAQIACEDTCLCGDPGGTGYAHLTCQRVEADVIDILFGNPPPAAIRCADVSCPDGYLLRKCEDVCGGNPDCIASGTTWYAYLICFNPNAVLCQTDD